MIYAGYKQFAIFRVSLHQVLVSCPVKLGLVLCLYFISVTLLLPYCPASAV